MIWNIKGLFNQSWNGIKEGSKIINQNEKLKFNQFWLRNQILKKKVNLLWFYDWFSIWRLSTSSISSTFCSIYSNTASMEEDEMREEWSFCLISEMEYSLNQDLFSPLLISHNSSTIFFSFIPLIKLIL